METSTWQTAHFRYPSTRDGIVLPKWSDDGECEESAKVKSGSREACSFTQLILASYC